mmetsp:Transcript_62644/g.191632  ORF Transcript_62644/g.191632 Transcript_62644/m.191632 type:complete len:245 (+) Transcript_62644:510-1244(+)
MPSEFSLFGSELYATKILMAASRSGNKHARCSGVLPSEFRQPSMSGANGMAHVGMPICCRSARRSSVLPRSTASHNVSCRKCLSMAPCCSKISPPSSKPLATARSKAVASFQDVFTSHSVRPHSNLQSSASPRSTATCRARPRPSDSAATCMVSMSLPCHAAPRKPSLERCTFCANASLACSYWKELVNCLLANRNWQSKQPQTVMWPLLWICLKPPCNLPSCTRLRTLSALRPSKDMSSMCWR